MNLFGSLPVVPLVIALAVIILAVKFGPTLVAKLKGKSAGSAKAGATAAAPSIADEVKAHIDAMGTKIEASAKAHASAMYTALKAEIQKTVVTRDAPQPALAALGAAPGAPGAAVRASAPAAPAAPAAVEPPSATVAPAAPPAAPAPSAEGSGTDAWPRVVAVHGVNMRLDAPVNPDYKPSMTAWIFGHQANTFVGEPSNGAKVHLPLRSPAGYPLFYAIGGDGKAVGTPSVLQGDEQFNSDAEVAAYNAATTWTPEQVAQNNADWARTSAALAAQSTPPHAAPRTALEATYANAAALRADIVALKFSGAVTLDGAVINSGFGKPDGSPWAYATQPDGTVKAA